MNILTKLAAASGDWFTYVLIGLMVVGVFFMMTRSSKARKKDAEMQDKIVVGTRVMTGSGIRGVITEINKAENSVMLKTGTDENPCYMEFDRRAISYLMEDVLKTLPAQKQATEADVTGLSLENPDRDTSEGAAKKTITDKNEVLEEVESPKE